MQIQRRRFSYSENRILRKGKNAHTHQVKSEYYVWRNNEYLLIRRAILECIHIVKTKIHWEGILQCTCIYTYTFSILTFHTLVLAQNESVLSKDQLIPPPIPTCLALDCRALNDDLVCTYPHSHTKSTFTELFVRSRSHRSVTNTSTRPIKQSITAGIRTHYYYFAQSNLLWYHASVSPPGLLVYISRLLIVNPPKRTGMLMGAQTTRLTILLSPLDDDSCLPKWNCWFEQKVATCHNRRYNTYLVANTAHNSSIVRYRLNAGPLLCGSLQTSPKDALLSGVEHDTCGQTDSQ